MGFLLAFTGKFEREKKKGKGKKTASVLFFHPANPTRQTHTGGPGLIVQRRRGARVSERLDDWSRQPGSRWRWNRGEADRTPRCLYVLHDERVEVGFLKSGTRTHSLASTQGLLHSGPFPCADKSEIISPNTVWFQGATLWLPGFLSLVFVTGSESELGGEIQARIPSPFIVKDFG